MSEPLGFRPIVDFSVKHPDEKFYQLDVVGVPFGFFYVSPDVSTLIWQGTLSFAELHQEALEILPSRIDQRWPELRSHYPTDAGKVTLILEARDLLEYDFFQRDQYNQYISTLQTADGAISFARYDVRHISEPVPVEYSLTAEFPGPWATHRSELTILLPKSQPWTESLLEWVIEHHVEAWTFRQEVNLREAVDTLSILRRT